MRRRWGGPNPATSASRSATSTYTLPEGLAAEQYPPPLVGDSTAVHADASHN